MTLYKLDKYYPDYNNEIFDSYNIQNFLVFAEDEKVGFITNILVDANYGRFRYFIIDTGFWVFSIKVLLPVGLARLNYDDKHLYVPKLTKEQVNNLPEFNEDLVINNDYEQRVRDVCRPLVETIINLQQFSKTDTYNYTLEPYFYELSDRNLKIYEQQLIEGKHNHHVRISY